MGDPASSAEVASSNRQEELYGPGASQAFLPGALFEFTLKNGEATSAARAVVRKAFTPFTQAQVLLVDVSGIPWVTGLAVLKIYDPRFERCRDKALGHGKIDRPWTLRREIEAAERRALRAKEEVAVPAESADNEDDCDDDDGDDDDDSDDGDDDPLDWEDGWLRICERQVRVESACYERLAPHQGRGVAVCYGVGSVHAISPDPATPRPISPGCILLEYIDGDNLHTTDPTRVPRPVSRSLLETVHAFAQLGVCHTDLHRGNYIFSPSNASGGQVTRAVIIDFSEAGYRGPDCSDSEWDRYIEFEWDFKRVCMELHRVGIRYEDPMPEEIGSHPRGAVHWNHWASKHPRWVDRIGDVWVSADGIQFEEPVRWRLKPEVKQWLEDPNRLGVDPPRPGSPGYS